MKRIYYLIIFVIFIQNSSCNRIKKNDLIGEWRTFSFNDKISYSDIKFSKKKIQLLDNFSRIESGEYYLKNDELNISLNNYKLKSKLIFFNNDSIEVFNKTYYKVENSKHFELDEYRLIGIDSNEKLSVNSNSYNFHLYSEKGITKIRFNEKIISLNDVKTAFFGEHHNLKPTVELFVGENIKSEDLTNFYIELEELGIKKITLIVKKENSTEYKVIKDSTGIKENILNTNKELIIKLK